MEPKYTKHSLKPSGTKISSNGSKPLMKSWWSLGGVTWHPWGERQCLHRLLAENTSKQLRRSRTVEKIHLVVFRVDNVRTFCRCAAILGFQTYLDDRKNYSSIQRPILSLKPKLQPLKLRILTQNPHMRLPFETNEQPAAIITAGWFPAPENPIHDELTWRC